MTPMDALYARILQVGLLILRQAHESGNRDWVSAELELLHNVPSLIGEANTARHRYFWDKERMRYMEWASAPGRDHAKSRMTTYYLPIWDEMEPLMAQLLDSKNGEKNPSRAAHPTRSAKAGVRPSSKRPGRRQVGN